MEQNSILHTTLSLDSDIPLYAQLVAVSYTHLRAHET